MSNIAFDEKKDRTNIAKHGISLARATDMRVLAIIEDDRFDYGETRYRAFVMHIISLRRAHVKEMARYVTTQKN